MIPTIALLAALLPAWEMRTIDRTAGAYCLTMEQRALMVAIRKAENGRPALAFGVADRRCRSYDAQARWTANTIRRRYRGDLPTFAARWCPNDAANWLRNVRFFMRAQGINK